MGSPQRSRYLMTCNLCQNKNISIDYKNTDFLRKFVSGTFKIKSGNRNTLCKMHQRDVSEAVKRARFMALMPYTRLQTAKRS